MLCLLYIRLEFRSVTMYRLVRTEMKVPLSIKGVTLIDSSHPSTHVGRRAGM